MYAPFLRCPPPHSLSLSPLQSLHLLPFHFLLVRLVRGPTTFMRRTYSIDRIVFFPLSSVCPRPPILIFLFYKLIYCFVSARQIPLALTHALIVCVCVRVCCCCCAARHRPCTITTKWSENSVPGTPCIEKQFFFCSSIIKWLSNRCCRDNRRIQNNRAKNWFRCAAASIVAFRQLAPARTQAQSQLPTESKITIIFISSNLIRALARESNAHRIENAITRTNGLRSAEAHLEKSFPVNSTATTTQTRHIYYGISHNNKFFLD